MLHSDYYRLHRPEIFLYYYLWCCVFFKKKRIETIRLNVHEIGYNHLVGKVAFNSTDFPVVTGFHCLMTVMWCLCSIKKKNDVHVNAGNLFFLIEIYIWLLFIDIVTPLLQKRQPWHIGHEKRSSTVLKLLEQLVFFRL